MRNSRERFLREDQEENKKPKKTTPNIGLVIAIGISFGLLLKNIPLGLVIGIIFAFIFANKIN